MTEPITLGVSDEASERVESAGGVRKVDNGVPTEEKCAARKAVEVEGQSPRSMGVMEGAREAERDADGTSNGGEKHCCGPGGRSGQDRHRKPGYWCGKPT